MKNCQLTDLNLFKAILQNLEYFAEEKEVQAILALIDAPRLNIDKLRGNLLRLLSQAESHKKRINDEEFYDAIYCFLLLLAKYFPTNDKKEGAVLCYFSQEAIPPTARMLSASGAQFDANYGQQTGESKLTMYYYLKEKDPFPMPLLNHPRERAYLASRSKMMENKVCEPEIFMPAREKRSFWSALFYFSYGLSGSLKKYLPQPRNWKGHLLNNTRLGMAWGARIQIWGGVACSLLSIVACITALIATGGAALPAILLSCSVGAICLSLVLGLPLGALLGGILGGLFVAPLRALIGMSQKEDKKRDPHRLFDTFNHALESEFIVKEESTYSHLLQARVFSDKASVELPVEMTVLNQKANQPTVTLSVAPEQVSPSFHLSNRG